MTENAPTPERFDMFSDAAGEAVARMIEEILQLPLATSDADLREALRAGMNRIAETHPEAWDTEVRERVISRLESRTGRALSI